MHGFGNQRHVCDIRRGQKSDISPIDAKLLHCGQGRRDAASHPFF